MVDEEKTNKESINPTQNNADGDAAETLTLIGRANSAAERMEKANEQRLKLLREEQELEARRALGGQTEQPEAEKPKEVDPKEYAENALKGMLNG